MRQSDSIAKKETLMPVISGLILLCTWSCGGAQTAPFFTRATVVELMDVDRAFSTKSLDSGMTTAFLEYAAHDAVLLRKDRDPIEGIEAVRAYLGGIDFSGHTLTWEPKGGKISASGDLGYTYGIYTLMSGEDKAFGTYVSVWTRDDEGNWKWVLDTGNPGLSEKVSSVAQPTS